MGLLDEYIVGIDGPWGDKQAAHLWRRAGFGAAPSERATAIGNGDQTSFRAAVDALVDIQADDPHLDQPAGSSPSTFGAPFADIADDDELLGTIKNPTDEISMIGHWVYRMRYTSQPLQEQLALFLHDHMVSDVTKLYGSIPFDITAGNDGSIEYQACDSGTLPPDDHRVEQYVIKLLQEQNDLFRHIGIDGFRDLLIQITRNPAMLVYLDNWINFKDGAQENFAREVMELFSMGVGNYSEFDVQQIAKCLTGETLHHFLCELDYQTEYGFVTELHEPGEKTVFGQTIAEDFTGQETLDVINLILQKRSVRPNVSGLAIPYNTLPATAVYMSWKLLTWFVSHDIALSPVPDQAVLELAHFMRGSDDAPYPERRFTYDIRACLRKLFLSKFFYSDANFKTMYKNPADFTVGTLKCLEVDELFGAWDGPGGNMLLSGMRLYSPPNVAGWNHGKSWINSSNLIARYNYANRLAQWILGSEEYGQPRIDALLSENGGPILGFNDHLGMIEYFRNRLIQDDLPPEEITLLLTFLDETPEWDDGIWRYRIKMQGLIHLMMCMQAYQLK